MQNLLAYAADLGLYHPSFLEVRKPHTHPGLGHPQARAEFLGRHCVSRGPGRIVPAPASHALPKALTRAPCSGGSFCSRQSGVPSSGSIPRSKGTCHVTGLARRLPLRFAHVIFRRAGPAGRLRVLVRVRKASAFGFPLQTRKSKGLFFVFCA